MRASKDVERIARRCFCVVVQQVRVHFLLPPFMVDCRESIMRHGSFEMPSFPDTNPVPTRVRESRASCIHACATPKQVLSINVSRNNGIMETKVHQIRERKSSGAAAGPYYVPLRRWLCASSHSGKGRTHFAWQDTDIET